LAGYPKLKRKERKRKIFQVPFGGGAGAWIGGLEKYVDIYRKFSE
jgi:hypothetical protein